LIHLLLNEFQLVVFPGTQGHLQRPYPLRRDDLHPKGLLNAPQGRYRCAVQPG